VVFTAVVFAAVDRSMTHGINTYCIPTLVLFHAFNVHKRWRDTLTLVTGTYDFTVNCS
jgi:hypothetical protein